MTNYTFEPASLGDVAEIMALYRSLFGTPGCMWDENYPSTEITEHDIGMGSLYVLRDGGRIIATASVGDNIEDDDVMDSFEWQGKNNCDLARIGVLPELHGRGIGTQIVAHASQAAKARGFDGMRLFVVHDNYAALAMYSKYNFINHGIVTAYDHRFHRCEILF